MKIEIVNVSLEEPICDFFKGVDPLGGRKIIDGSGHADLRRKEGNSSLVKQTEIL